MIYGEKLLHGPVDTQWIAFHTDNPRKFIFLINPHHGSIHICYHFDVPIMLCNLTEGGRMFNYILRNDIFRSITADCYSIIRLFNI